MPPNLDFCRFLQIQLLVVGSFGDHLLYVNSYQIAHQAIPEYVDLLLCYITTMLLARWRGRSSAALSDIDTDIDIDRDRSRNRDMGIDCCRAMSQGNVAGHCRRALLEPVCPCRKDCRRDCRRALSQGTVAIQDQA